MPKLSIKSTKTLKHTFTLTTGVDSGSKFVGGAGNDTFTGFIDTGNASTTTLTAGDNLDGGDGTDALNVTITGSGGASTVSGVTLKNIERIQVQNTSNGTQTVNLALASGYKTLSTYGSSQTVVFDNVSSATGAEMANGSSSLTLNLGSALTSGTSDSVSLSIANQSGGTFTTGAGIETVAITSTGSANTLALAAGDNHKKVTVAGDQKLTLNLNDNGNTITTVDASAAKGAVVLTGVGTGITAITGGAGADKVTIAASTITSTVTLDGGDGSDTLVLNGVVAKADAAKVSNFETVSFVNAGLLGGVSQDASAFASATLNIGNINNQNFSITNLGATQAVTVTAAQAGTISTDLKTNTTADTTSVTLGSSSAAAGTVAGLTVANAETVSLTSLGAASSSNTITTLTAAAATKLNVAASVDLTISTLTAGSLKTVDASASTAAVSLTAGQAMTITGGAGNDVLGGSAGSDNIDGGSGNNSITGGGGNDTLTGGAGNDTITGGAGNDTIVTGDGTNKVVLTAGGSDKVTGGAGSDTIQVNFGNLGSNGTDTINGGDGTDTLEFADNSNMNFGTDPTILNNVSNIEQFKFSAISAKTVSITDGTVGTTGGSITLVDTADNASNVFDASNVFYSGYKVTLDASALANNGVEFKIGNAMDKFTGGAAADTVTVSTNAFLSANDTINGGAGADTLKFTSTTGGTISTAQLSNVSSMEAINVTTGGAGNFVFTLTDAVISPNATSTNGFTVSRNSADTGSLKVDASAVTSAYNLTLSGGGGADTLVGGAGADTLSGGNGADSLTGGAGNDTFSYTGAETGGPDTITDFNFGTSSTSVDVFAVAAGGTWQASGVTKASAGTLTAKSIVVLDTTTYADLTALDTAVKTGGAQAQTGTNHALLLWQDTLGNVHVTYDADGATSGGMTDLAILSGVTIVGIASLINPGDFSLT
jgi:Ca2+-binding RTX toxin-like protein